MQYVEKTAVFLDIHSIFCQNWTKPKCSNSTALFQIVNQKKSLTPSMGYQMQPSDCGSKPMVPLPQNSWDYGRSPKYCLFSIGFNLYPMKRHSSIFVSLRYVDFNRKSRNTYRNASFFQQIWGFRAGFPPNNSLIFHVFSMKYPMLSCVT